MSNGTQTPSDPYVLATGTAAVRRLHVLHAIYSPVGRRVLLQAGLREGMKVADFGCGVGAVTQMLAHMVGPSGTVTGIDVNAAQLEQAEALRLGQGLANTSFVEASADSTGLPRDSYDLVYCRFLLLHLVDPAACLREMRAVLRPGGILVVEDGDLASATSEPPTAIDAFADLFGRWGTLRGLDYSLACKLVRLVTDAGFTEVRRESHQPVLVNETNRHFLKWSVQEAGPALIDAGIITSDHLEQTLSAMQDAIEDPDVRIFAPRMSLVWARKERAVTSVEQDSGGVYVSHSSSRRASGS